MATLLNIFQQYCALSGKSDSGMDSMRFYKFCKEYDLIDGNLLTKSDVDIIYLTHTKNKHVRYLSYTGFNLAITDIAEKKITDFNNLCEYIVSIGRGPNITGTVADHNRFFDDKSTYTGVYNKGGPTIIDRNASASFWSSEGYHNLKADHDNFHQSAAVSRGAMAVKDYQFMLSQKDNVRGISRASSRHSSPGPSSRMSSASSSSMPKSVYKSRAKITDTESRTNHFRMTSNVIKPKTDYKLNERISDETNASLQHYFYLYSSPPGCKSQNGLDGGRFRKFIMDNKKLLLNLKVFKSTEIDILFTKFKDSSISKLTYEGFLCCIQEIALKYKLRISELTKKIDTAGYSVGPIRDYTQLLPNRFYDDESTYTGVHKAGGLTIIDPNMNAFWGSNGVISPHKLYEKGRREGNSATVKSYKGHKKRVEPWNTNILFGRLFENYFDNDKKFMSSSRFLKFCRNVEIIDNDQIKLSDIAKLYNYVVTEDTKTNVDDVGKKVMYLPQFYKALDAIAETRDIDVNDLVLELHDMDISLKTNNSPQLNKIDVTSTKMDAYENNKIVGGKFYNYESNILALQSNDYNLIDNSSEPYEFSPSLVDNSGTKSRNLENIECDSRPLDTEISSKFEKHSFIQPELADNEVDIFHTIYEIEHSKSNTYSEDEDEKDDVDDESVEDVEISQKNDSNFIKTTQRGLDDPIMSGFLEKKTDKSNIVVWHRRYFVLLSSGILEYYINELDKVNNIVGNIIDLRDNDLTVEEAVNLKHDKIFIKLNNSASQSYLEYVLHADNPSSAALWVQNIKSVYDMYHKTMDNIECLNVGTKNCDVNSSIIESEDTNFIDVSPLIYGYLQKKSNNDWMGWQKRYVILRTNGEIVYYASEGDWDKKPPKGIIDLKNAGLGPDEVLDWNKDKFSITVKNGKSRRVYSFIAKDQDLAARWVQSIKIVLKCSL